MKPIRSGPAAALLTALLILNPLLTQDRAVAADATPPFTPPWGKTQERIPPEVKDKESEQPTTWCEDPQKKKFTATFVGPGGVGSTTIERKEIVDKQGNPRIKWEIKTVEPGKPKKVVTYNLAPDGTGTRTEEIKGQPPTTTQVKPADLYDPKNPPKKGARLFSPFSTWLVNVAYREGGEPRFPAPRAGSTNFTTPLILAATEERSRGETPSTQERPVINIKIVTYGKPDPNTVIHFDPGPETTPEEFLTTTPTTVRWDPKKDGEGPGTTHLPGDGGGVTITEIPGGGINIGTGWTSTRIPASNLVSCSSGDDADELIAESRKLMELAKKAEQGGPQYWDRQEQQYRDAAVRAEQQQRGPAKRNAERLAKEAKETADALRQHNIPDKPDPKLPKPQLDKANKERQDAIQGIRDEARDLLRRAQALLKDA